MPLYRYFCAACRSQFEIRHSYTAPITQCQGCESDQIERLLDMPVPHLNRLKTPHKGVGEEVRNAIEEAKDGLEVQKEELRKKNQ